MRLENMRHEIKYIIPLEEAVVYQHKLAALLGIDTNSRNGKYTITSLYYDDVNNSAFTEKVEGHMIRHKYRLRYYNDEVDHVKLECKSKFQQMTHKKSQWLEKDELLSIFSKEATHIQEHSLLQEFMIQRGHKGLRPVSLVRYERVAFIHPLGDTRITFDYNVRGQSSPDRLFVEDKELHAITHSNEVIMEIKFNGMFPSFLRQVLASQHQMATSSSKFVYSRLSELL